MLLVWLDASKEGDDCPDLPVLAGALLPGAGMKVSEDIDGWMVIGSEPRRGQLALQRVTEWVPLRWPDPAWPQLCASTSVWVTPTGPSKSL